MDPSRIENARVPFSEAWRDPKWISDGWLFVGLHNESRSQIGAATSVDCVDFDYVTAYMYIRQISRAELKRTRFSPTLCRSPPIGRATQPNPAVQGSTGGDMAFLGVRVPPMAGRGRVGRDVFRDKGEIASN